MREARNTEGIVQTDASHSLQLMSRHFGARRTGTIKPGSRERRGNRGQIVKNLPGDMLDSRFRSRILRPLQFRLTLKEPRSNDHRK